MTFFFFNSVISRIYNVQFKSKLLPLELKEYQNKNHITVCKKSTKTYSKKKYDITKFNPQC